MKSSLQLKALKSVWFISLLAGLLAYTADVHAEWRKELGTLRVGIVTGKNTDSAIAKAEPFRLAIQENLEIPVELSGVRDLPTLIRSIGDGKIEYAIYSASSYAATWNYCECVEPLVVAKSSNGSKSISSIVITHSSSGISSAQDLAGKKILALSPQSIGGYAFAAFELSRQSVELDKNDTEVLFVGTGELAVRDFIDGSADAIIGWSSDISSSSHTSGTLKSLVELSGNASSSYRIIWNSSAIPNRVHAVRKNLAGEAKTVLQNLLMTMFEDDPVAYDAIEPNYGGGFEIIRHPSFLQLTEFAKPPARE